MFGLAMLILDIQLKSSLKTHISLAKIQVPRRKASLVLNILKTSLLEFYNMGHIGIINAFHDKDRAKVKREQDKKAEDKAKREHKLREDQEKRDKLQHSGGTRRSARTTGVGSPPK